MSVGTTSIESLPNEIGKNNVNLTIKETPQPKGPIPTQLSKDSINQIVSGLQEASASGLTNLPSRDLPMNNQHISQDEQQKPNYIPEPEKNDYIEDNSDFESILKRGKDEHDEQDRLDILYEELQTPILVMILFFAFNLPYFNKSLIKNMPSLFLRDGNLKLSGYVFKTFAFGVSFYGITKMSKYLSEY
tara:strand:- start:2098 stop:2664 length:567 start_codon:yes stop_codon:yes gene_type:complete